MKPRGFASCEGLVVIAVAAIILAILFPLYVKGMEVLLQWLGWQTAPGGPALAAFLLLLALLALSWSFRMCSPVRSALQAYRRWQTSRTITILVRTLGAMFCAVSGCVSFVAGCSCGVGTPAIPPEGATALGYLAGGLLCLVAAAVFLPAEEELW